MIKFLEDRGVERIYMVTGGMMMHLMDSLDRSTKIKYICTHHEQVCAMAAEGDQRVCGKIGVAMCTSGPGSTNMVTGVVGAFEDSIPCMFISGQAATRWLIGDKNVRQVGVQEVEIIKIIKPITKYQVIILDANSIRYHLEKAFFLATHGRPGPVWIDIPLDIQGRNIDPDTLQSFDPNKEFPDIAGVTHDIESGADRIVELLKQSKRPLLLCGHGVRLAEAIPEFRKFMDTTKIPVVCTKNAIDIVEFDNDSFIGMPGIYGYRSANFAVQAADLVISIGCRFAPPLIGYSPATFAPKATLVVLDIDKNQLDHPNVNIHHKICGDAKALLNQLNSKIGQTQLDIGDWRSRCLQWKKKYPLVLPEYKNETRFINAYFLMDVLSKALPADSIIVQDQGTSFIVTSQGMRLKKGQRMFTNAGLSSMGYGIAAAIGACFANNKRDIICIHGDGGLQFNIQELQTIAHHKLPIKFFILNNNGYVAIKYTMRTNFNKIVGSDPESGLSIPDLKKISFAYGINYIRISNQTELVAQIDKILKMEGPLIVDLFMDPFQPVVPRVQSQKMPDGTMESKPLDDMYPFLDRKTYIEETRINGK